MADHPSFTRRCVIVARTGSHAEPAGCDRWRAPTYNMMVNRTRRQQVIITGLRFDRPAEAIRRVLAAGAPA